MAIGRAPHTGRRDPGGADRGHGSHGRARVEDALVGLRADEAADARLRRASMGRVAAEESSLAGVLVDLAERGVAVVVRTVAGGAHRGRLVQVGPDHCVVASGARRVLAALVAITVVEPVDGDGPGADPGALGHRRPPDSAPLAEVLAQLGAERTPVVVTTSDGAVATGDVDAVGVDVVVLRVAPPAGGRRYVRLGSVAEVAVSAADWTGSG